MYRMRLVAAIAIAAGCSTAVAGKSDTAPIAIGLDPQAVLSAPPAPGSAQAMAEIAELHAMQNRRTPADIAAAKAEGSTKDASIFADVLGPKFDLAALPATAHLFDMVRATEKATVDHGKGEFRRSRPWIVDPTIESCAKNDDPLSSYPSGHTSMAFSMAGVMARLVPEKAPAILARAARYGESRIVCEQHFRSDVTAGEALGLLIAERLMQNAGFARAFGDAGKELARAGLTASH